MSSQSEVLVDEYTNGVLGPHSRMIGPVADGGRIVFITAPGCWGRNVNLQFSVLGYVFLCLR